MTVLKILSAFAAVFILPAAGAQAQLFSSYVHNDGSFYGTINFKNDLVRNQDISLGTDYFCATNNCGPKNDITGMVVSGNSIFVSQNRSISQYSISGTLLRSYHDSLTNFGPLSLYNGALYASYVHNDGSFYGALRFAENLTRVEDIRLGADYLCATADCGSKSDIRGMAVSENGIFISQNRSVSQYSSSGALLRSYKDSLTDFGPLNLSNGILYASYVHNDGSFYGAIGFGDSLNQISDISLGTDYYCATSDCGSRNDITGMAISGNSIFISQRRSISEYSFKGEIVRDFKDSLTDFGPLMFVTEQASVVPEPDSWVMMISGFGAVAGMLRRRRRNWGQPVRFHSDR